MTFTRIQPRDNYTVWLSGIYKIVSYRPMEYLAFYLVDGASNWGDHVSAPPHEGKFGKCWRTLRMAKAACEAHAKVHQPKAATVRRAGEIKATLEGAG